MNAFSFDQRTGCMAVSGEFCVYQAQQAKAALLEALKHGGFTSLDLSEVTEFDCAALQLVLSLGDAVHVSALSDRVQGVLSLLNITLPSHTAEAQA